TRMYPLGEATNSESYNGFHRAFIPEIFQKKTEAEEE
ncbi:2,4-dienoyl-CoA reductase, partial [Acinetobacter baumannii]